jgi:hypothetical protein
MRRSNRPRGNNYLAARLYDAVSATMPSFDTKRPLFPEDQALGMRVRYDADIWSTLSQAKIARSRA